MKTFGGSKNPRKIPTFDSFDHAFPIFMLKSHFIILYRCVHLKIIMIVKIATKGFIMKSPVFSCFHMKNMGLGKLLYFPNPKKKAIWG